MRSLHCCHRRKDAIVHCYRFLKNVFLSRIRYDSKFYVDLTTYDFAEDNTCYDSTIEHYSYRLRLLFTQISSRVLERIRACIYAFICLGSESCPYVACLLCWSMRRCKQEGNRKCHPNPHLSFLPAGPCRQRLSASNNLYGSDGQPCVLHVSVTVTYKFILL